MSKTKNTYPEISEIRDDLDSLKDNVVELTRHLRSDGWQQAGEVGAMARSQIKSLKTRSRQEIKKLERQVKQKPAQSLAIAFAAGAVASMLLRGRR